MKFKPTILMAILGLCAAVLHAQVESERTVRFTLMALPSLVTAGPAGVDDTLYDIHFFNGTAVEAIGTVPYLSRSQTFVYRGAGPLVLLGETNPANGHRAELARIDLAAIGNNVLLLVRPQPDSDKLEVFTLPQSTSVRSGRFHLVNLSQLQVGVVLDEKTAVVMPYGEHELRVGSEKSRMVPLRLATRVQNQPWQAVYTSSIPLRSGCNLLCLILPDPGGQGGIAPPVLVNEFIPPPPPGQSDAIPGEANAPQD